MLHLFRLVREERWWIRDEVVWHKPNPMPSSVTDRTTPAHEMVYLLTKSARYFMDMEAIAEPAESGSDLGLLRGRSFADGANVQWHAPSIVKRQAEGIDSRTANPSCTRNKRSVWTIPTQPYPGAHFATFPEKLVERCLLAGTSARGCCPECGAPWVREVERIAFGKAPSATKYDSTAQAGPLSHSRQAYCSAGLEGPPAPITTGWRPSCGCIFPNGTDPYFPVPCTVLDPFAGTGTVGLVAQRFSRRAVLIDLNPDYLAQCMKRTAQSPLGLTE